MPVYVMDSAFETGEAAGIAAFRAVVRGSSPTRCVYPAGANDGPALGVTLEAGEAGRAVAVRRLGRARVAAAEAIAAGRPVVIADALGRVKAAGRATGATGSEGANNALRWTAREFSLAGNAISVAIKIAGNNTPLSVEVNGAAITVHASTDGEGAATATAAQVAAAVAAHPAASLLVTVENEGESAGAGAVTEADLALSGGEASLNILGLAEEAAAAEGDEIEILLTP